MNDFLSKKNILCDQPILHKTSLIVGDKLSHKGFKSKREDFGVYLVGEVREANRSKFQKSGGGINFRNQNKTSVRIELGELLSKKKFSNKGNDIILDNISAMLKESTIITVWASSAINT